MEFYNSINNLKTFKYNILTNKYSEQDIIEFIKDINAQTTFNKIENNLLVFEIYYLLMQTNISIPLIVINLNTIPAKLIFNCIEEMKPSETTCVCCQETQVENDNNASIDCNTLPLKKIYDEVQLKKDILAKWTRFSREEYPNLSFPTPGNFGNVFFTDEDIIPGKRFHCEAQIDSEGNVLKLLSGPTEILEAETYEEIYAGLVGKLFDFQQ